MAHVQTITVFGWNRTDNTMRVAIALHPAGEVSIDVPYPEALHTAILRVAQTAADAHEAQMQAQLIGEKAGTE
jgi:hypothetical protein